jgi:hypothetical protein
MAMLARSEETRTRMRQMRATPNAPACDSPNVPTVPVLDALGSLQILIICYSRLLRRRWLWKPRVPPRYYMLASPPESCSAAAPGLWRRAAIPHTHIHKRRAGPHASASRANLFMPNK